MVTRVADILDRLAVFVFGVVLLMPAAAVLLWRTDLIAEVPGTVTLEPLLGAAASPWWPWALGGAGAGLVVTAAAWLLLHVPRNRGVVLRARQPGDCGTITVDLAAVAAAAAAVLEGNREIRGAQGKAIEERRTRVIAFSVTVEHPGALAAVIDDIDATCSEIAGVTGDPSIAVRTMIELPKRSRTRRQLE
ncbi:MAG: hypothetical protein WBB07_00260 [Mycobacterium sp.]